MVENVAYRWESARRYYAAVLVKDLLGDWVVQIACGGLFNRLGHVWTVSVASVEAGRSELAQIAHVRGLRRYRLV